MFSLTCCCCNLVSERVGETQAYREEEKVLQREQGPFWPPRLIDVELVAMGDLTCALSFGFDGDCKDSSQLICRYWYVGSGVKCDRS